MTGPINESETARIEREKVLDYEPDRSNERWDFVLYCEALDEVMSSTEIDDRILATRSPEELHRYAAAAHRMLRVLDAEFSRRMSERGMFGPSVGAYRTPQGRLPIVEEGCSICTRTLDLIRRTPRGPAYDRLWDILGTHQHNSRWPDPSDPDSTP